MNSILKPMSFADIFAEPKKKWKTGDRWGCWKLVLGNRTLVKTTRPSYYIDLDRCLDSASVLDWICQVAGKTWATPIDVGNLVRALNDVLRPQQNMCGMSIVNGIGRPMVQVDVKKILSTPHH